MSGNKLENHPTAEDAEVVLLIFGINRRCGKGYPSWCYNHGRDKYSLPSKEKIFCILWTGDYKMLRIGLTDVPCNS